MKSQTDGKTTKIENVDVLRWDALGLDVQFGFDKPLAVSGGQDQDNIVGSVREESLFLFGVEEGAIQMQENDLKIAIPKQLPKGVKEKVIKETISDSSNTLVIVVAIQLIAQIILKRGKKDMLIMFFMMQYVQELQSIKFESPAPLTMVFEESRDLSGFKFLNINWILGLFEPNLTLKTIFMSKKERFMEEVSKQETSDFLITSLGLFVFASILFAGLVAILSYTKEGRNKAGRLIQEQKNTFIWNGIIMWTYCNFINLNKKAKNMISVDPTSGILFSAGLLAYPALITFFLRHNLQHLNSKAFRLKFEAFYRDLRVLNQEWQSILYFPIFLYKRWSIVMISLVMGEFNTGLQFFALLNLNKAGIIVYGQMQNHLLKPRRRLEYFNDMLVVLISYTMLCMTSWVDDEMIKYYMGYIFIGLYGLMAFGNTAFVTRTLRKRWVWTKHIEKVQKHFFEYHEELIKRQAVHVEKQKNHRSKLYLKWQNGLARKKLLAQTDSHGKSPTELKIAVENVHHMKNFKFQSKNVQSIKVDSSRLETVIEEQHSFESSINNIAPNFTSPCVSEQQSSSSSRSSQLSDGGTPPVMCIREREEKFAIKALAIDSQPFLDSDELIEQMFVAIKQSYGGKKITQTDIENIDVKYQE